MKATEVMELVNDCDEIRREIGIAISFAKTQTDANDKADPRITMTVSQAKKIQDLAEECETIFHTALARTEVIL